MPLNAVPQPIFRGVRPPASPDANTVWLSESVADMSVSPSPAHRRPIITGTLSTENNACQEPKGLFYNSVTGLWNLLYTGGIGTTASSIHLATAPHPYKGPWTKVGRVLGAGTGGYSSSLAHGGCLVEGTTVYRYVVDPGAVKLLLFTADMSDLTSWTARGEIMTLPANMAINAWGNVRPVKRGDNDYVFFFEALQYGWQMGTATGTSALGPFTFQSFPILALQPDQSGSASTSGPFPLIEDGVGVIYYHGGPAYGLPTDIYRAKCPSGDMLTWEMDNNGYPILRREHALEVDQVADFYMAQGPGGEWWAVWDAFDNATQRCAIMCGLVHHALKRWTGTEWVNLLPGYAPAYSDRSLILRDLSAGSAAVSSGWDVPFDTTAAALTATLPHGARGAVCRISNVGAGSNALTIAAQSGETIGAATSATIAPGVAATFRCYKEGVWVR